jgi:hypothetical protein
MIAALMLRLLLYLIFLQVLSKHGRNTARRQAGELGAVGSARSGVRVVGRADRGAVSGVAPGGAGHSQPCRVDLVGGNTLAGFIGRRELAQSASPDRRRPLASLRIEVLHQVG